MAAIQKHSRQTTLAQLDLFSVRPNPVPRPLFHADAPGASPAQIAQSPPEAVERILCVPIDEITLGVRGKPGKRRGLVARPPSDVRLVSMDDMPSYTDLDHEMIERSLETLPEDKVWFTYSAVQKSFGISRATVARRMKEGLIPGIRFNGANVLEDGPVRRFNRIQLRWLLLAVRTSRAEHTERSMRNLQRRVGVT